MSVKTLLTSFSAGGGGGNYWALSIDPSDSLYTIRSDSSNNYYITTLNSAAGANYLFKISTSGSITWSKTPSTNTFANLPALAINSTASTIYVTSFGGSEFTTLTSSGTFSSGLDYGFGYLNTANINNTNGNFILTTTINGSSVSELIKYNSSKTFLLGKYFPAAYQVIGQNIDSSDNIYTLASDGANIIQIIKISSTGTITWQRRLTGPVDYGSTSSVSSNKICVDSSGNVYVEAMFYAGFSGDMATLLVKLNSSGVVQWQKLITGVVCGTMNVDSSGNIVLSGFDYISSSAGVILKYDTSGTLLWQRVVSYLSAVIFLRDIVIDSSSNIIAGGEFSNGIKNIMGVVKIAGDGTTSGTYGNWNISTSTLATSSTATFSSSTTAITLTASTAPSNSSSSYTMNDATLTTNLISLG